MPAGSDPPAPPAPLAPPQPARRPVARTRHGETVVDEYAWLRDRSDPAVRAHLEAENAYTRAVLAHTEELQARLYEEIKGRVQETDEGVPARRGDWWYLWRSGEGLAYALHCRRHGAPDGPEQVLLDENAEAEGFEYFAVGAFAVSPDHRVLAWSSDTTGAEVFTMRFRDLDTGEDLPDEIPRTYYGAAWADDNRTLFYTMPDAAMRPHQVWRHVLGTPASDDVLVYQEDDEHFFCGVHRTRSGSYVVIEIGSKVTSEARVLDAGDPAGAFRVVAPREPGVEYSVEHQGDRFLIVTNAPDGDGRACPNFRLVEAPLDAPGREHWREVLPHDDAVRLYGVEAFAGHVALHERRDAVAGIRILDTATGAIHPVEQPEAVSTATPGTNLEYDTTVLRYGYTSLVTPDSVYDYDMVARTATLRKRRPVLGGYDPDDYESGRLWATAPDGERIPISVVHRRGVAPDGTNPCLLYGYGSYEISIDPTFSSARLSLLDRGFVYAIAHVRGGGEGGRRWYEAGKLLAKANTFTDFVACAEHLVAEGWTRPDRLAIRGGSAGGLLVGAVLNLRPDLFGAAAAEVPFVDALNTILDPSLPLTVIEWDEWGNPVEDEAVYRCMRGYAPYENVRAADYPAILVTAGLHDPRVSYWEPAKWVARLRDRTTGDRPILLKCDLGAGHGGPSGRYEAWREEALVYAFLLDSLGVAP